MLSSAEILKKTQRGLLFSTPDHGCFVRINYKASVKVPDIGETIISKSRSVLEYAIACERENLDARPNVVVGFNPKHWQIWNPHLTNLEQRPNKFLVGTSAKFLQTGGDIFFYIKAEEKHAVKKIEEYLEETFADVNAFEFSCLSSSSGKRILQRSFSDGLVNASDAESLCSYTIIGEDSTTGSPGGCYMMTQKFEIDWLVLGNMWNSEKEDMIGRKMMTNCIIPNITERSHILRAHFTPKQAPQNMLNKHRVLFRQSLPYGTSKYAGREEGIFYVSFANTTNSFKDVLESIVGHDDEAVAGEVTTDLLMNAVKPLEGTWWYVPSAQELGMKDASDVVSDINEHWNIKNPENRYMFYNQREYLHRMTTNKYEKEVGGSPTPRVLKLVGYVFRQWNDQWFHSREVPPIMHLNDYLALKKKRDADRIMKSSVLIRKAMAIEICLGQIFTSKRPENMDDSKFYGNQADLFNIHPDEIIVGRMPNFSLGLGKVTMPYLNKGNEEMEAFLKGLSENASIGHIIPNMQNILGKGVSGFIKEFKRKLREENKSDFLKACIQSLKGIKNYILNYAALARHLAKTQPELRNPREYPFTEAQRDNLLKIAERMEKLATQKPETFVEAAQLIFSIHCCLHLIGEPTSVGRLDRMLEPYRGQIADEEAQEIIDCFFLKLGERVLLNKTLVVDRRSWGTTAVPYRSDGTFPNGDAINQWVQQVTIGGYESYDDNVSACNKVTMMCLKAARRLPLNAPCVALRVHKGIGEEYLEEAANALLSGGAHPIILHDNRLLTGLKDVMKEYKSNCTDDDLKKVDDVACDGCYEPLIAGKTEFAFTYIPLLKVLEMAMNQGATLSMAGPAYLKGTPQSLPTTDPVNIKTFEQLKNLYRNHFEVQTQQALVGLLENYGNLASVCPSPLLSTMIDGCVESGRDLTDGGSRYKMISIMHVSFSNTVDALYAIKRLCFDQDNAVLTLSEIVTCLKNDWGYDMQEPTTDRVAGDIREKQKSEFYKQIREQALKFPKFGTAKAANVKMISEIASFLADCIANTIKKVVKLEGSPVASLLSSLRTKYSRPGNEFDLLFVPGSGTFEGYVGWGLSCAASADGRRRGTPIASDMSAAPLPQDLPPETGRQTKLIEAMQNWNIADINTGVCNGAEIDLNIKENFKKEDLVSFLKKYANGKDEMGGNIVTVTCANPETYIAASQNPEQYDLLRVRTGGWSEYFISFFKAHQEQHIRRIYYSYK